MRKVSRRAALMSPLLGGIMSRIPALAQPKYDDTGARGAMLRAYDKATGEEKGAVYMPAPQTGSPMSYMLNGEQYIVVATGGGSTTEELLAFRLPRV